MNTWFVRTKNGESGPYDESQLMAMRDSRQVSMLDEISSDGKVWRRFGTTPLYHSSISTCPSEPSGSGAVRRLGLPVISNDTKAAQTAAPSAGAGVCGDFAARGESHHSARCRTGNFDTFSIGKLFSEVFRRHSQSEVEDYFSIGFPSTTPKLEEVDDSCPRPWVFVRTLVISLVLFFGFLFATRFFHNTKLIPGLIAVGAFAVPLSVVIFFFEVNIRRNVSICQVLCLVMLGGLLSLIFSLLLYGTHFGTILDTRLGDSSAGVVEEVGKILAVVAVASFKRYPYRLNGILFGASIGAGFAAFESAGYVFEATIESGFLSFVSSLAANGSTNAASTGASLSIVGEVINRGIDQGVSLNGLRAILSPFGHIVWTAIAGAAFWRARKEGYSWAYAFTRGRFLALFLVPVALHAIWNSNFDLPFMLKYIAIGLVGWGVVLALVSDGISEVRMKKASYVAAGGMAKGIADVTLNQSTLNFAKGIFVSMIGAFCASLVTQFGAFVFSHYVVPLMVK